MTILFTIRIIKISDSTFLKDDEMKEEVLGINIFITRLIQICFHRNILEYVKHKKINECDVKYMN